MNLSKQVVSLDLAKRLRELGAPQDSYFVWVETKNPSNTWYRYSITNDTGDDCGHGSIGCEAMVLTRRNDDILDLPIYEDSTLYAAYAVAELGEHLPVNFCANDGCWYKLRAYILADKDGQKSYHLTYESLIDDVDIINIISNTLEAEARGLMLVWLIEQGYVKFGEGE